MLFSFIQLLFVPLLFSIQPNSFFTSGLNILVIPGTFGPSHMRGMAPMAKTLALRGHDLSIWMLSYTKYAIPGNEEGLMEEMYTIIDTNDTYLLDGVRHMNNTEHMKMPMREGEPLTEASWQFAWFLSIQMCREVLETMTTEINRVAHAKQWDMIIIDPLFTPCGYLLAKKLEIKTFIPIETTFNTVTMSNTKGLPLPIGAYPQLIQGNYDPQSIYWRIITSLVHRISWYIDRKVINTMQNLFAHHGYPEFGNFDRHEYEKEAPLFLFTFSQDLDFARPTQFNLLSEDKGCPESKSYKNLPRKIEAFVSDPKSKGTILLAFGTIVWWDAAPEGLPQAIARAVALLPQYRIVWQLRTGLNISVPENVLLTEWLPQADILNEKRTVALMTHGGIKTVHEAACAKMPTLILPFFADQARNGFNVANRPYKTGRVLFKYDLDHEHIANVLLDVATNPVYKRNAQKLYAFMKDKIMDSQDHLAFWVERAAMKKMEIFRSKSAQMNYLILNSYDVVFFFIFTAACAITVTLNFAGYVIAKVTGAERRIIIN